MKHKIQHETEEPEEWDEAGFEAPPWLEFERADRPTADSDDQNRATGGELHDLFPADHPIQLFENLRTVYDLEESLNAYGRTIYIEQWDRTTGKPKIWYVYDKDKVLVKYVRGPSGITTTYLGKTKYI